MTYTGTAKLTGTDAKRQVLTDKIGISERRARYLRSTGKTKDATLAAEFEQSAARMRDRLADLA